MTQQEKKILKSIQQIIYTFSERTPPSIKKSNRNYLVAKVALTIDELMKTL